MQSITSFIMFNNAFCLRNLFLAGIFLTAFFLFYIKPSTFLTLYFQLLLLGHYILNLVLFNHLLLDFLFSQSKNICLICYLIYLMPISMIIFLISKVALVFLFEAYCFFFILVCYFTILHFLFLFS